jgi:transcription elongation factor Elf1
MASEVNKIFIKNEPEIHLNDQNFNAPLNNLSTCFVKNEITNDNPKKKPPKSSQQPHPFTCPHCPTTADTKQKLSSHLKIHKHPTHKCHHCDRLFKSPKNMARHSCAICTICHHKSNSKADLRMHMKQQHAEAADKIYSVQCDFCGKLIKTKTYLIHHIRAEHVKDDRTTLLCSLCGIDFPNKFMLIQHGKVKHADMVACRLCQKMVKPLCMPYHMKQVHASERNFLCTTCSATFKTKDNLKDHMKTHNKALACDVCDKRFARRFQLTEHRLLHNDPSAFTCMVCGHKYSTASYLKRHMRAHENGNVRCRVCGVDVNALSMHYHMKNAHPLDRFRCGKCGCGGFGSQREFGEHLRGHEQERVVMERQRKVADEEVEMARVKAQDEGQVVMKQQGVVVNVVKVKLKKKVGRTRKMKVVVNDDDDDEIDDDDGHDDDGHEDEEHLVLDDHGYSIDDGKIKIEIEEIGEYFLMTVFNDDGSMTVFNDDFLMVL